MLHCYYPYLSDNETEAQGDLLSSIIGLHCMYSMPQLHRESWLSYPLLFPGLCGSKSQVVLSSWNALPLLSLLNKILLILYIHFQYPPFCKDLWIILGIIRSHPFLKDFQTALTSWLLDLLGAWKCVRHSAFISLFGPCNQPYEAGIITTSILKVRKLEHREVKTLAQGDTERWRVDQELKSSPH